MKIAGAGMWVNLLEVEHVLESHPWVEIAAATVVQANGRHLLLVDIKITSTPGHDIWIMVTHSAEFLASLQAMACCVLIIPQYHSDCIMIILLS